MRCFVTERLSAIFEGWVWTDFFHFQRLWTQLGFRDWDILEPAEFQISLLLLSDHLSFCYSVIIPEILHGVSSSGASHQPALCTIENELNISICISFKGCKQNAEFKFKIKLYTKNSYNDCLWNICHFQFELQMIESSNSSTFKCRN